MSSSIHVVRSELDRLRTLVELHSEGRDAVAAERLAAELDRAVVVDVLPPGVVALGSRVRFEDERSRVVREAQLVYPRDADASAGRISVLAPIGAALLGLSTGDSIAWPLPGDREARIRILSVEPPATPTAA
ncbi:MAG: nucleoside diphosphate kinase regulator [Anaeromyxobacteraceae bacterium]